MSLLPQQPYAYLYINKVVVSFDGICQNVRISVVSVWQNAATTP